MAAAHWDLARAAKDFGWVLWRDMRAHWPLYLAVYVAVVAAAALVSMIA